MINWIKNLFSKKQKITYKDWSQIIDKKQKSIAENIEQNNPLFEQIKKQQELKIKRHAAYLGVMKEPKTIMYNRPQHEYINALQNSASNNNYRYGLLSQCGLGNIFR